MWIARDSSVQAVDIRALRSVGSPSLAIWNIQLPWRDIGQR
jgi:hypothetical protein